ncbi:MAG: UbiX family flavin prenyltransferase [Kiritimatiellae bacterium]|nr:UbiX family flavin prenyltransferase [Kiritimatiellia bacterium]
MNLIIAITGATGAYTAKLLIKKAPWPVSLIISPWGQNVYERECGNIEDLKNHADAVYDNDDLSAPIASGSVPTVGMVILPCSANTMGKIASGHADSLITRAAQCHLKEQRRLILCVRESPWSSIQMDAARTVAGAGGIIMPLSPPFYMFANQDPQTVTAHTLLDLYADRVLALLGQPSNHNWETASDTP